VTAKQPADIEMRGRVKDLALVLLAIEATNHEKIPYRIAEYIILLYGQGNSLADALNTAEQQLLAAGHNELVIADGKVLGRTVLEKAVRSINGTSHK